MIERCVDASVIVKLVLKGEPHRVKARRLVRESINEGIDLIVPAFFTSEVDTVIRKLVYDGSLSQADAQRAYTVLDRAPVRIVTHPGLRQRAREIAEQFNQRTVYDATYAALAELSRRLSGRVLDGGQGVLRYDQGSANIRDVSAQLPVTESSLTESRSRLHLIGGLCFGLKLHLTTPDVVNH